MPVFALDSRLAFPDPNLAEEGLLAVGGDLRPERLLLAYESGIFPWYEKGQPILWHSPDPRMVLETEKLHVPASLEKAIRRAPYRLTLDAAFPEVIQACSEARPDGPGTWITDEMKEAYVELHRRGYAHSAEAWEGQELAGGLYGVSLGGVFFGESMFARRPDASKIAFVALARRLEQWKITLVDCQVYTRHLERFGAREWPRKRYLSALRKALAMPGRTEPWSFSDGG
ncbi:MAG: leucyl/phenylalanyl-tRNA--protein transferase [Thermoanaerobaculia bacterium]